MVKTVVERLWGKHEMREISTTDNGLYIFRFMDRVARDWVLENGPWYFFGRPIILRSWKPGMEMLNVQITSLPRLSFLTSLWNIGLLPVLDTLQVLLAYPSTLTLSLRITLGYPLLGYALRWT